MALVLLSSIGFAVLAWVQQNIDAMSRMRAYYTNLDVRKHVAEWSYTLNPMETPSGEFASGPFRIRWTSEIIGDIHPQAGYPQGVGLHDIAMYNINVSAQIEGDPASVLEETLVLVGHKKIRSLAAPF